MRRKYKIWLVIIGVLLVLTIGLGVSKLFMPNEKEKREENVTNVISNIDEYGYSLDDRDTDYMKEVFKDLEKTLKEKDVNYEDYAKNLAKLFVIDFYTLNNKINKYDVGSLEYILNDKVEIFKNKAMDTIYSDIIDNTYKDRVQELPEITDVEILEIKKSKFELNKEEKESYKITLKFSYKKDLGYDKEGTLHIIENNNKLEVALYNPKIEK